MKTQQQGHLPTDRCVQHVYNIEDGALKSFEPDDDHHNHHQDDDAGDMLWG